MRAALYVRISQDRAGERAGVTRQLEDCERRAAERGWSIVARHEDNDLSAAGKRRRPGFESLLADIRERRCDVVCAWALDRFQRNRRDEVALYEACRDAGVTISLVNGADLDFGTAAGRFVADSLGSVARLEIELKSDRQCRAAEQAAQNGQWKGGRRPFGYEPDGVTVRPGEAALIRQGFADLLAGVPLAGVARAWNDAGATTGQGGRWRADNVRHVLRSPRYAGLRGHKGTVAGPAVWPALVPEETWRAVVDVLADPSRRSNTPRYAARLLTGIGVCGVCRAPVHAGGNARRGVAGYRCSGSLGHFARKAEPIDSYVGEVVVARLSMPDAAAVLSARSVGRDVGVLRTEGQALRVRLDSLAVEFADGDLTASQLRAASGRLRERLAAVDAELAAAGRGDVLAPLVGAGSAGPGLSRILESPAVSEKHSGVLAVWDSLSLPRRRAVVAALMVPVVFPVGRGVRSFDPGSVGVEWVR